MILSYNVSLYGLVFFLSPCILAPRCNVLRVLIALPLDPGGTSVPDPLLVPLPNQNPGSTPAHKHILYKISLVTISTQFNIIIIMIYR